MVNNKIAQRAVAAGLSGLMAFGAAAPAALAWTNYGNFKYVKTNSTDDSAHWKRLAGDTRYDTMKKIVESYNEIQESVWKSLRKGYSNADVYNYHSTAVLASGDNWPDALAANGLAGYLTNIGLNQSAGSNASVPVLITKASALTSQTKDLLKGMQVQNVIIMGGTAAISQDVEDAINKMGIGTQRVAGADRQETSIKAMQRINGNWEGQDKTYDLIIASGNNYADALSISPYAYRMGTPIILTDKDGKLTDAEVEAIRANDKIKEIVIVGGTSAVKDEVLGQIGTIKNNRTGINVVRVAGVDRYETSAKIAEFELKDWSRYAWLSGFTFDHAVVATGENFPDALVGGQLAGGVMMPNIDVKDFSAADLNAWTPCPLLLTKDGDTRADSMIARGLAAYRVSTGTDTFASFGSWVKTVDGWYEGLVDNDKVLYNTLMNNWYYNASPMFISDIAVDANIGTSATTAQPIVSTKTEDIYVTLKATGNWTWDAAANANVFKGYDFSVKGVQTSEDVATKVVAGVVYGPSGDQLYDGQTLTIDGLYWQDDVHGVATSVAAPITVTLSKSDVDVLNKIDVDDLRDGVEVTFKAKKVTWNRQAYVDQDRHALTGWQQQIIGYVDSDDDFYGIILGGKAAVSNDKRDDLENTVKNFGYDDDVFTVGTASKTTIQLVDDKGVSNNYLYLAPEGKLSFKKSSSINVDGNVISSGFTGDLYKIYGTDSHVVAVFDPTGNLVTWLYYYGSNSGLYTDWSVVK